MFSDREDEQRTASVSSSTGMFHPSPRRAAAALEGDIAGSSYQEGEEDEEEAIADGGGPMTIPSGMGVQNEGQAGVGKGEQSDEEAANLHIDFGSEPELYDDYDEEEDDDDGDDAGGGDGDGSEQVSPLTTSVPFIPMPYRANAFAPPFYNRPPTPLPPSPSLTSLLRPAFSTTTSRPTTPDSSDIDTTNETEAAVVAKSAQTATTVPRASPRVPTYEYYGFVLYLTSCLAFLIYLLWSYLPSPFLHQVGVYYYPNRWWSLAIPSYLVMLVVYIFVALAAYNTGYLTLPMNSIENIVDDAANVAVIDGKGRRRVGGSAKLSPDAFTAVTVGGNVPRRNVDWRELWNEGTDAVMDVPVGGVCEVLYGNANARDREQPD